MKKVTVSKVRVGNEESGVRRKRGQEFTASINCGMINGEEGDFEGWGSCKDDALDNLSISLKEALETVKIRQSDIVSEIVHLNLAIKKVSIQ